MSQRIFAYAAVAAILVSNVHAENPLKSGPPVGAENDRDGFRPQFVAGPSTGKRLCPV
jgi:hypothetical protein